MTCKNKTTHRIFSALLATVLLICCVPLWGITSSAAEYIENSEDIIDCTGDVRATKVNLSTADDKGTAHSDNITGNFTISSVIEHSLGSEYKIPSNVNFDIEVTLSGPNTKNKTFVAQRTGGGINNITTDKNGSFTLSLCHNDQVELFGLPEGTIVTVSDNTDRQGFNAVYYDNGVKGDGIVTVIDKKTVSVIVNHIYVPEKVKPTNIDVWGIAEIVGRDWEPSDEFTFELQRWTGINASSGQWTTLGTEKVYGTQNDKTFDIQNAFVDEEYTQARNYYYRVVEIEPSDKIIGMAYDKMVHSFAVKVTDKDMDGKLEIDSVIAYREDTTKVTRTDDGYAIEVDFINTFDPKGDTVVTIEINKFVENPSNSSNAVPLGFEFGLYDESGNLVMTSRKTTSRGFTRMVIADIHEPGTHRFTLKEQALDGYMPNWDFSRDEIGVNVNVFDYGDGVLGAVIYKDGENADSATSSVVANFTNRYEPTAAELAFDFVSVKLTGRETPMKADDFTFEVQSYEGETLLKGTNDEDGNVNFDDVLSFNKVGRYFINVVETTEDSDGVVIDKNTYRITVKVDDDNGVLTASYELVNAVGYDIVFENMYVPSSAVAQISGQTSFNGSILDEGEFTFELYKSDENWIQGDLIESVTNDIEGYFDFSPLNFRKVGNYYYLVKEKNSGTTVDGVVYDDTVYRVQVSVFDDLKGALKANILITDISLVSQEKIVFNNQMKIPEPSPDPTAPSELKPHKPLEPDVPDTGALSRSGVWLTLAVAATVLLLGVFSRKKRGIK